MTTLSKNGNGPKGVSKLPRELRRWLPMRRRPTFARWTEWVSSLAQRYSIGSARTDHLGMTLLVPPQLQKGGVTHRWFLRSQSYFPRINLTIQPYLRTIAMTAGSQLHPLLSRRSLLSRAGLETVVRRELAHQSLPGNDRVPAWYHNQVNQYSGDSVHVTRETVHYVSAGEDGTAITRRSIASPIELAFRRSISDPNSAVSSSLSKRMFSEVVRRVKETRQRIELTATPSALITKERNRLKDPSADSAEARWAETRPKQASPYETASASRSQMAPQPNIDQLTDQVLRQLDRKIVAARERAGKTF